MKAKILIIFAAGMLFLTGCGADTASSQADYETVSSEASTESTAVTVPSDEYTAYTSTGKIYQLYVPNGWTESSDSSDRAVFTSADGRHSLTVEIQDKDVNLLAYTKADFRKSYKAEFENFKLKDFKKIKSDNGSKGVYLEYTFTQNENTVTVYQTVFAGENDYSVTYSSIKPTDKFKEYAEEGFSSFKELDPTYKSAALRGRLNGRKYKALDGSYSFKIPTGWLYRKSSDDILVFENSDGSRYISFEQSDYDSNLFQYQKDYFQEFFESSIGGDVSIDAFKEKTVNGRKARYLEISYTYGGITMSSCQYIINGEKNTYTITITSASTKKSVSPLNEVVNSLTLNEG